MTSTVDWAAVLVVVWVEPGSVIVSSTSTVLAGKVRTTETVEGAIVLVMTSVISEVTVA